MSLLKLTLKTVWYLIVSMVGVALTMMVYHAIEDGALIRAFKVEINWEALSAIGSLLAVAVALLYPMASRLWAQLNIVKLIETEIKGNMQLIKQVSQANELQQTELPKDMPPIPTIMLTDALIKHLDLRNWNEFKYQLAIYSHSKYEKYGKLNKLVESICNKQIEPDAARLLLQLEESKKFMALFYKEFGGEPKQA